MPSDKQNNSSSLNEDIKIAAITFVVAFVFSFLLTLANRHPFSSALLRSLASGLFIAAIVFGAKYFLNKMLKLEDRTSFSSDDFSSSLDSKDIPDGGSSEGFGSANNEEEIDDDDEEEEKPKEKTEEEKRREREIANLHYSPVMALEESESMEGVSEGARIAASASSPDTGTASSPDTQNDESIGDNVKGFDAASPESGEKSEKNSNQEVDKNSNMSHNSDVNIKASDGGIDSVDDGDLDSIDSIISPDDDSSSSLDDLLGDDTTSQGSSSGLSAPSLGRGMRVSEDGSKIVYDGKDGEATIPNDPEQIAKAIRTMMNKDEE